MQVSLNPSINKINPQFKARFSQKDVKVLMKSSKDIVSFEQDVIAKGVELRTGIKPENAKLTANAMYGKLNAILDHVDKLKGKVMSLVEEKLPNGEKIFKIVNEDNKVLGSHKEPIIALDNAFVMRYKYELAPEYWGDKMPLRVLVENQDKIGRITEQDVLAKALN